MVIKLITILTIATIACGLQTQASISAIPAPIPQYQEWYTIEITGQVNLRDMDGIATGYALEAGTIWWGRCDGSVCVIRGGEYTVWRGCVDNNPDELGCKSQ